MFFLGHVFVKTFALSKEYLNQNQHFTCVYKKRLKNKNKRQIICPDLNSGLDQMTSRRPFQPQLLHESDFIFGGGL